MKERGDECVKGEEGPAGCRSKDSVQESAGCVPREPRSVFKLKPLEFVSCLGHSATRFQMENSFPVELAKYLE